MTSEGTDRLSPNTVSLRGADGLTLAADLWGPADGATVLMLHGGGQTRHSWKATSRILAQSGMHVVALDLRGHGDSDWSATGEYGVEKNCEDVREVLDQIGTPATIIGASMGGLTGLLAARAAGSGRVDRLALVDVVPRLRQAGTRRIINFMRGAPHGFASLDEAAEAIAAYLPHRERRGSTEGLRRNLRLRDGRWYWHWDPKMMTDSPKGVPDQHVARLESAARSLTIPVLLLHGVLSDVVSDEGVAEFRSQIPHLEVVRLSGAAHTAAGDDNDAFTAAVVEFCTRS